MFDFDFLLNEIKAKFSGVKIYLDGQEQTTFDYPYIFIKLFSERRYKNFQKLSRTTVTGTTVTKEYNIPCLSTLEIGYADKLTNLVAARNAARRLHFIFSDEFFLQRLRDKNFMVVSQADLTEFSAFFLKQPEFRARFSIDITWADLYTETAEIIETAEIEEEP